MMRPLCLSIVMLSVVLLLGGCVVTMVTSAASAVTNAVQSWKIDRLEEKIERGPQH